MSERQSFRRCGHFNVADRIA